MTSDIEALARRLELVVFDFDGVFTDNKVYVSQDGVESVRCDRSDGIGLARLRAAGLPMFILSTEANPVVAARAAKLRLDVVQNCGDKAAHLASHLQAVGGDPARVAFVGNDTNDLAVMRMVGLPVCPADAHPAVREIARWVLTHNGGDAAVREFCDRVADWRGDAAGT